MVSKREYIGIAGQQEASPDAEPPPAPLPDTETIKKMVFSGFFNADLGILKLPRSPAIYRVWVELGEIPSNEVTIQTNLSEPKK